MAIIGLIKWNAPSDCSAWEVDSEELSTNRKRRLLLIGSLVLF
jgi:hypothetical protein